MSEDPNAFVEHVREKDRAHRKRQAEHTTYLQRLERNPFDKEAQQGIEKIIHENNVHKNYEHAMEHNPEVFGSVHMLYVNAEVRPTCDLADQCHVAGHTAAAVAPRPNHDVPARGNR